MTDRASVPTDPVSLPMDVKRKLLAARDALAVGDLMEAHHQIYSIASPHFNKLADEVWTALETPTPDSPGGAGGEVSEADSSLQYRWRTESVTFDVNDAYTAVIAALKMGGINAWRGDGTGMVVQMLENAYKRRAPEPSESRTTSLLLSQAARLLREYADDAHAEDVPDVLRWLAVYEGRTAPEPGEKARLMEYAVAAGDAIVAGVPQWRDGWAIISRIQTDPPNERWMLHDADERETESRAEAEQLEVVNTGMDFAVVPIKWRTPTKAEKL